MKITTTIPREITSPNSVKTRIGTLKFFEGMNWIQTVPGKSWNTVLRLYGPLEPYFDKTWRPGEIELVK
jgi:hypothetical protein